MPTAQQITNRAFSLIGVKRAGLDPSTDDTDDAIVVMNAIFEEMQASGITFGAHQAISAADETHVPGWAQEYVSHLVGLRLSPDYDATPGAAFAASLKMSKNAVLKKTIHLGDTLLPSTMPLGAGNRSHGRQYRNFFADPGYNDLTDDQGNSLQTETGCVLFLTTTEDC